MKKTTTSLLFLILTFLTFQVGAQNTDKKATKEAKRLEEQQAVETLLNSGSFQFKPRSAMPAGRRTTNLNDATYFVNYTSDLIESALPYFGRVTSSIGYGGDEGMNFKGAPENYSMEKTKKTYQVNSEVKGNSDRFKMTLSVTFSGAATLTIISNKRSSISYNGEISAIPPKKEKK